MSTELVELRSFYAHPGFLLLARDHGGEPIGCVGIRALDATTGEVRRLFVRPAHRSAGVGRRLLTEATTLAQHRGLTRLVLNTLSSMTSAQRLYGDDGYLPVAPYVPNPVSGVNYLGRNIDHGIADRHNR
jgi:GNAT superfamily N-acetyltransferase